jgi:DNA polymerase-3 subunit delta
MYRNEFELQLKKNHIYKSVLFFGLCVYSFEYFVNKLISLIGSKDDIKTVYFDEYDFDEAKEFLSQSSLFSDSNILLIKTTSKIDAKELKALIEMTTKIDNSYLIISLYPNNDDAKYSKISASMQNQFLKAQNKATFVRFFKPNLRESMDFISNKAKIRGVNISSQLVKELYFNNSENLELSIADLEKLRIYQEEITPAHLEEIKLQIFEISIDDFMYKILEKKDIFKDYKYLCLYGLKEIEFISRFASFVQSLILFNIYIRENGNFNSKDILGYKLPKQIEEKRAKTSILFNIKKYEFILNAILGIDLALKGEVKINKQDFLFSKLLQIQSNI